VRREGADAVRVAGLEVRAEEDPPGRGQGVGVEGVLQEAVQLDQGNGRGCLGTLRNMFRLQVAPYSVTFPEEDEDEWDTSKGIRVMGLAYVPDYSQSAFACIATPDGEITDHRRLPHILKRKNSYKPDEKMMKESDLSTLRDFILTKKPHVIAIGGESREALMIADDLKAIVTDLVENEQFPTVKVEIIDNELAKVYAISNKGVADFRDYPELLRQAISLARKMQDPLVEYSQLCNEDEEILSLRFHPLQVREEVRVR
jgi:transcription elongation factor SPT6